MKKITTSVLVLVLLVLCQTVFAQDNYINYLQRARQRLEEGDCDAAQRNYAVYHELTDKSDREVELLIEECKGGGLTGTANGHEYVDLGLPSGILWATCNIGASKPEDYGNYYAWGETESQTFGIYNWASYKYANDDKYKLTKYCNKSDYGDNSFTDSLTVLQSDDDPATVNWGSGWRVPTKEEFQELCQNTTLMWTTQNGVEGGLFTSKNGQTLFLPAAGSCWTFKLHFPGSDGCYWSRSLDTGGPNYAWSLSFNESYSTMSHSSREGGYSVRPVRKN